ncbi:hypothetical protein B0H67DRAFT_74282 [Lasiosphaeris hirsuta]|uniref:Major facilitator superfamily transporter n=1 Tax=Lasiosphaeris hirsuta TaxID=260670 RepID=A0AA40BC64_9PEZI|nr:hypothetical protein B0H67DRAFT_74282 [Lasiosphaeris hirsuta]
MGLSSLNPLGSREAKRPKLPLYKELDASKASSPTKEKYSDDDYSTNDSDSDASDYSEASPPSSRGGSRHSSSSMSSAAGLMHTKKKATFASRRPVRRYLYRLPNRLVRYLCIGMMSTIIIFIFCLVRASQVENKRISQGKLDHKPAAPPPWESFEFLTRYYGGIRTLVPFTQNTPQYPKLEDEGSYNATKTEQDSSKREEVPDEPSSGATKIAASKSFPEYPGSALPGHDDHLNECFLDEWNTVQVPSIRYMDGRPLGFPDNILGSYELLSLPEDICFDRFGRYGPYGYGYSVQTGGLGLGEHGDTEGSNAAWKNAKQVDWHNVDWADAQRRCFKTNAGRYAPLKSPSEAPRGFFIGDNIQGTKLKTRAEAGTEPEPERVDAAKPDQTNGTSSVPPAEGIPTPEKPKGDMPRTAIVIRCWDEFLWREEDVMNLRALIAELSLASGGRYDVHLLVQVRNDAKYPVWADDETYRARIREAIPREFQGMVTLWSETQMLALYQGLHDLWVRGPDLPVHGSYRGLQMAMQHFAYNHPEYEYFWQWEMDIRYTGHYYDLLTKMERWAKEQPRKGLWERNARFYMPYVHGAWEDFKQMARVQTEHGTLGADNIWDKVPKSSKDPHQSTLGEETIWGPKRPVDKNDWFEYENDPLPHTTYERDKYKWGVGEEAELITLSPIFDPDNTSWKLADDITGYNETGGIGKPPRRAQIITASRMSRRLLLQMHRETAFKKHHAFPEMWPATVALQHGYKAVYAPHPVFVDREWPTEYMARILNGGRNGASGGSRTSVFGDREHNMKGLTWFYNAGFSANIYRRWLGLRVNNDGGEEFEVTPDMSMNETSVNTMRGGEGRMCLPPMLLHPIKDVDLPVEELKTDTAAQGSDPSA